MCWKKIPKTIRKNRYLGAHLLDTNLVIKEWEKVWIGKPKEWEKIKNLSDLIFSGTNLVCNSRIWNAIKQGMIAENENFKRNNLVLC